jgi:hypothetical protein
MEGCTTQIAVLASGITHSSECSADCIIDGQNPPEDREFATGRAYLQNTVGQFSKAFGVHAILAVVPRVSYLSVLPALALVHCQPRFVSGQIFERRRRALVRIRGDIPPLAHSAACRGC